MLFGVREWYVFDRAVPNGDIEVFVNWGGFRLYDDAWAWAIERFWKQMVRLNPESYLAEGTVFTFATRDSDLFNTVVTALSAASAGTGRVLEAPHEK